MLDGKSQRLDLEEGGLSQDAIEIDTKGMCGELAVEAGAQAPESTGMIAPGQGEQAHALVLPEVGGFGPTDVGFVAEHGQIGVLA